MNEADIRRELVAFEARWAREAMADTSNEKARWIAQGVRITVNFLVSLLGR